MGDDCLKIVVLDGYAANPGDIGWDGMSALGELTVYDRTAPCEVYDRIRDAEIVLTNKVVLNAEMIGRLPKLRYIGVIATGTNIVDGEAAKAHGIPVTNVPGYSTMSVAQLAAAFLLEMADHVGSHSEACMNGAWTNSRDFCFWNEPLIELDGKTMGVIGYGAIGRQVGAIASALGMKVIGYRPSQCDPTVLDRIYREADVISLNCPLKADNRHMINARSIAKMKKGVWIINTARGPLVDEQAVADALASGQIGRYGADVVDTEPIPADSPLLHAKNVFLTPHVGWATKEARIRLMEILTENVRAFLNGTPVHVVNE